MSEIKRNSGWCTNAHLFLSLPSGDDWREWLWSEIQVLDDSLITNAEKLTQWRCVVLDHSHTHTFTHTHTNNGLYKQTESLIVDGVFSISLCSGWLLRLLITICCIYWFYCLSTELLWVCVCVCVCVCDSQSLTHMHSLLSLANRPSYWRQKHWMFLSLRSEAEDCWFSSQSVAAVFSRQNKKVLYVSAKHVYVKMHVSKTPYQHLYNTFWSDSGQITCVWDGLVVMTRPGETAGQVQTLWLWTLLLDDTDGVCQCSR